MRQRQQDSDQTPMVANRAQQRQAFFIQLDRRLIVALEL
jgi:hypothetical protein